MPVWIWWLILFICSWIPFGIAKAADVKPNQADEEDRRILAGLSFIDATLTIASFVFLFLWISWWALIFFGLAIGIMFIMSGLGLDPYRAMKNA